MIASLGVVINSKLPVAKQVLVKKSTGYDIQTTAFGSQNCAIYTKQPIEACSTGDEFRSCLGVSRRREGVGASAAKSWSLSASVAP
jgi:hypothetical protein